MKTRMNALQTTWMNVRTGAFLGALLAILVAPAAVLSGQSPTVAQKCGASETNVPSEIVQLARTRDIWLEFPALRRAPQLEIDSPAMLVVFPANYELTGALGRPDMQAPDSLGIVLCVVPDAGRLTLLSNVDPAGSRLAR